MVPHIDFYEAAYRAYIHHWDWFKPTRTNANNIFGLKFGLISNVTKRPTVGRKISYMCVTKKEHPMKMVMVAGFSGKESFLFINGATIWISDKNRKHSSSFISVFRGSKYADIFVILLFFYGYWKRTYSRFARKMQTQFLCVAKANVLQGFSSFSRDFSPDTNK